MGIALVPTTGIITLPSFPLLRGYFIEFYIKVSYKVEGSAHFLNVIIEYWKNSAMLLLKATNLFHVNYCYVEIHVLNTELVFVKYSVVVY